MKISIYSECNKHVEQMYEYIQNAKRCRLNIRRYSEERKETNIYEYEYIRPKLFEYIRMSKYSLHTVTQATEDNRMGNKEDNRMGNKVEKESIGEMAVVKEVSLEMTRVPQDIQNLLEESRTDLGTMKVGVIEEDLQRMP